MGGDRDVARDISYAHSAQTRGGRVVIRVVENATGRIGLIRQARGYGDEIAAGRDFWRVMMERYGLSLRIDGGSLGNIPREGPLILVANHPYGILDGLLMGHILSEARGDFRILAHRIFRQARDLERVILPIAFDETPEARMLNIETRKAALRFLSEGGAIGIFPGGTVSTAATPFGRPMDPGWRSFTARMIAKSGATVVPVYFEGANSRLFQIASHLHATLRVALLIKEFRRRVGAPAGAVIGTPVDPAQIAMRRGDTKAMMDFLRRETYALSPTPLESAAYGFEFEDRYRA
ncbi:lysophospholipid acyltransferase family protein [Palleronia sp. KMU-117]|uniref:lysophospholipid acyltransferase family protein n=1 Tax=Palleronia sp. KMU-117 TaxID=3434108 RepID=UPI003D713ECD